MLRKCGFMVSSVSSPNITKTSIFYINDLHAQTGKMERIKTASDSFERSTPKDVNQLKLSGGDIFLGEDTSSNTAIKSFLNSINLDATALGNHEFDLSADSFSKITDDANYKMLGMNLKPDETSQLKKKLSNSYILEKDGEKYGIIGLAPFDLKTRIKKPERFDNIKIEDFEACKAEIQQTVDNFSKNGINKVILLSHSGLEKDREIAKSVNGIDVIIGGHSHELIKDIVNDKNLFYSKKGEPVIITQAGKDGGNFGVLNLEFDKNGVIKSVQNNVYETNNFERSYPLKYVFDKFLGEAIPAGKIKFVEKFDMQKSLISENPNGNLITDALKSEFKTDIAMVNSANLRGQFAVGTVYDRDISLISPFKNKMTIASYNEKELVDAIEYGGTKSLTSENHKPGIIYTSGLKYILGKDGKLKDLIFIDKENKEHKIDVKNPDINKTYSVALDDYMSRGEDGFSMLNKINSAQTFDFDKDKVVFDYIKKQTEPIEIKTDGRIKILDY